MYIKEINIDGFKSYAQRVTLTSLDPCFNAITGLNGSGKSNILDSICFVLGIKALAQVRAASLQELVYKQGQAGVTKATVSITFHNNDPKNGPAGYEDKEFIAVTRQIVIGGRDKYLINGHAATATRVQDLFHSVQLNVNNPHFLIMQGRIMKVINMKPVEILSLLEEASGTRLYEKKKEAAMKTMEKKQAKLDEIDQVINEDLLPTLATLDRQRQAYIEYATMSASVERLKRFVIAFDYTRCAQAREDGEKEVAELQAGIAAAEAQRKELEAEVKDREGDIRALEAEKAIQAGGEVKELQDAADALSMKLTRDTTEYKNRKDSLAGEAKALKALDASLTELDEPALRAAAETATAKRDAARGALEAAEKAVEAATREVAGAEAGDGRDESNKSLAERLEDARNGQTAADAEAKAADVRSKHLSKQLADARKAAAAKEKEGGQLAKDLAKAQAAVAEGQAKLQELRFDEAKLASLEAARASESAALRAAKERVDELAGGLAGVDFQYRDPEPGFDRSKVHGVVAKLVHVAEPAAATALEVVAGGRLYQVVVDSDATAKKIVSNGGLTKRVTIIPLNQIRANETPRAVLDAARSLGGGRARPAMELIGYDGELEAAMKYVFGGNFVADDAATAKKLAFSREVNTRCVTLEGDDFNPGGTLTGGSRNSSSVLTRLHSLMEAEAALAGHQKALAEAEAGLRALAANAAAFKKLKQEVDLRAHQLSLLQQRQAGSEAAQLAAQADALEADLKAAQEAAGAAAQKKADMVDAAKRLEREIADFGKHRDKWLRAAQDKLKRAKADVESCRKALKAAEAALAAAVAEVETAAADRAKLEAQKADMQASLKGLEEACASLEAQVSATKAEHEAATKQLEAKRSRLRECDKEIRGLEADKEKLAKRMADLEVEKRRAESKISGKRTEAEAVAGRLARLQEDYPWIKTEKAHFGRGQYDFSATDPAKAVAEYEECVKRLQVLKEKGVKANADAMYNQNKAEVDGLKARRDIVEKDKAQIQQVIEELDDKKREALRATWQKVNTDFGAIFSTLLPGTAAKLEPPEGQSFLDGLEVRVAFGGVWKDSLSELSGGQKSLLALSLILALCRFKPAPIYILDEVDSALDLNHTQNIGRMIKEHFPESQFIVVSLKEGMFNNANVIYRTKFVDGVSNVTRTAHTGISRENEGPSAAGKAAERGRSGRQALKDSNA